MNRAIAWSTLLAVTMMAIPGFAQVRTWTDSTGKHKTQAEIVDAEDDKVTLLKTNGKEVTLRLNQLSKADQAYVRAWLDGSLEDESGVSAASPPPSSSRPKPNNVLNSVRGAPLRTHTMKNLKQLALGVLNHESAKSRFPAAAILTPDDQPGLSWRVAILPFLDEAALYRQFKLDEPWDSEHNLKLIERMPKVFESPGSPAEPGYTNYLAVVGSNTLIAEGGRGVRIRDVRDGISKTMMLVEVDDDHAVVWTKPDDYRWDPKDPLRGLGNIWSGQFFTVFGDGHVDRLPTSTDIVTLNGMATRNGGEYIRTDGGPAASLPSIGR